MHLFDKPLEKSMRDVDVTSTTPRAGPGVLPLLLFWACGSTPRSTIPDLREYSPRVLPVYDFKGFGSTPRSAIPDLREYSHKSGIVPLGVLPDPLKLCTGSGHDMICRSVIILPMYTMRALPETKNMITGSIITSFTYILSGVLLGSTRASLV